MTELEISKIVEQYNSLKDTLKVNAEILDIFEGNLLPYLEMDLADQLSPRAYITASKRIPPVNVLKRVIDKLSKIYAKEPIREVIGTEKDEEMWGEYNWYFDINVTMQLANEYFNQHKCCALEPYQDDDGLPRLRVLPFDRFFVMNENKTDPLLVTHFIKVMGYVQKTVLVGKKQKVENKMLLFVYKDDEFLPIYDDGQVATEILDMMVQRGATDPKMNVYGKIPYVYINRSKTRVNPSADSDILRMTKLIPILMTDVNYAMMFQCFSLFVGVDVDIEKLEINPNSFISLKSNAQLGQKPSIDVIKPTVDSEKAMQSMQEQLALWLQSRNIRPGQQGSSGDKFNSGISKMVDEMDTSDERQKQIPFFKKAESDLYELISEHMHDVWSRNQNWPQELRPMFSKDSYLSVVFPEQIISETPMERLEIVEKKMKLGLISQETAMKQMYPDWDEDELKEEMQKISGENTVEIPEVDTEDSDASKETTEIQS